jgi:glycerophosphoryl diester phosphodiesterase
MGFNIKNNYGPNIEVNAGGKVTLVQDKNGLWHTADAEEAEYEEVTDETLRSVPSDTEELPAEAGNDGCGFVPDAKAIGKCFKFDSDFVKRSVRTLVTEFYQGNNANLALIEITLFHHQQLKRRNSHKPFVMALAAWGIITIANDEEFKLIVMGVSDKYKRMPDEGYQEWDDNYKTDRLTCERMGKKLDPSMKYLE